MNETQLRISISTLVAGLLGIAAILYAWWDSTEHYSKWLTKAFEIKLMDSAIHLRLGDYSGYPYQKLGFARGFWSSALPEEVTLFPMIEIGRGFVELPIWFLWGVFFSSLWLIWFLLMKRITSHGRHAEQGGGGNSAARRPSP